MKNEKRLTICVGYTLEVLLGKDFRERHPRANILYQEPETITSDDPMVCIAPSEFFGEQYGKLVSLPVLPLKEINGVPLLFGDPRIERKGNRLIVHADIIASTYFLVTRYEEVVRRDVRDEYGRFPGRESLPYRAGFIDRPIVEDYVCLLRKWLRAVGIDIGDPRKQLSVILTHDVDSTHKYWRISQPLREVVKTFLGRETLTNAMEAILVPLGLKKDPNDSFDELIKLAESFDEKPRSPERESVYFFMAGGSSKYDIRKEEVRNIIKRLHESGARIGLHTSYSASLNPELIEKEKQTLEEVCGFAIRHNRYHYLAWREVEDGWALANAGINWDSTLGYADVAGFRLGVCHPIDLFDPIRIKLLGVEEHPLIVMDKTLHRPSYMNFDEDEAFEYCQRLMTQTRRHKGEFVILWHNDIFARKLNNYHPQLYRKVLAELASG